MYNNLKGEIYDDFGFYTFCLDKNLTKLPVFIWAVTSYDDDSTPKVFVLNSYSDKRYIDSDLIIFDVNTQKIISNNKKINIINNDINMIKEYIKSHKDLFVKYWFDKIGIGKFTDMIKVK